MMLNDVVRKCDCQYLNDYITEKNIACMQYARLLFPALHNNKAEIVFKHRLFTSTYRIPNLIEYLEPFTSKQIDFACKNDVVNALPFIKSHGMQDLNLLLDLETFMRQRRYTGSTYDTLKRLCEELNFDCTELDKRIVRFVKKLDFFNALPAMMQIQSGKHIKNEKLFEYKRVRNVKIRLADQEQEKSFPLDYDGEFGGDLPLEIEVIPNAVNLLVPEHNAKTEKLVFKSDEDGIESDVVS